MDQTKCPYAATPNLPQGCPHESTSIVNLKIGLKGLPGGISPHSHGGAVVGGSWVLLQTDLLAPGLKKGGKLVCNPPQATWSCTLSYGPSTLHPSLARC